MRTSVLAAVICLGGLPLHSQFLLLDRELKDAAGAQRVGIQEPGFLADRLSLGAKGEVWIIDRLRMWSHFDTDHYGNVTLFGGLEAAPVAPGEFECDCHNLLSLSQSPHITRLSPSVWQLDFDRLSWSVPGGVEVQFGISAQQSSTYLTPAGGEHRLKLFDAKGKLLGPYAAGPAGGFAVQVWGHLPAAVDIRANAALWEVKLRRGETLEPGSVDQSSLRFGPHGAKPVTARVDGVDLVLSFRGADSGIRAGDLNACLSGKRQDGVPFEGCDLLKKAR